MGRSLSITFRVKQPLKIAAGIENAVDHDARWRDVKGDGNAAPETGDAQTRTQVIPLGSTLREHRKLHAIHADRLNKSQRPGFSGTVRNVVIEA